MIIKLINRIAILASLLAFSLSAFPQHPKRAIKAYEAAEKAFQMRDYQKAHQQLLKAILEDPNYAEAWLLEGEIGMETKDYDLAVLGYETALSSDSMLFPPAAITLARLYDQRGSYKREKTLLHWYLSKNLGNAALNATVADLLEKASFRDWATSHPVPFEPQNLGPTVNSPNDEYVNMLSFDASQLLFTRKTPVAEDFYKEILLVSDLNDGQWSEPHPLAFTEFPDNIDPGAAFISADGKKLYLTGCGWMRDSSCDLYVSEWTDGRWSIPRPLSDGINTRNWESQPCVSSDGTELYFVSRRNGNADIYRCLRNADGSWGEPNNLGAPINTKGTEMAPFLHPDGRTMYFSSDTHIGMGGSDLFMSRRAADGTWQEPVNLGFPINTSGDEINFFVAANGKTAFISSQRENGNSGYDIYTFELPEEIRPDSANYLSNVDVAELSEGDALVLQNIQFEYNSAALSDDSQTGILILANFLNRHPHLTVELAGHTDNVGSEAYNLKLSDERAQSVRQALIEQGIDPNRMISKGYGSSKPIVPNDNDDNRAKNRRTEMIITH